MISLLPLSILYFPCYVEIFCILNQNVFKKNPKDFTKHIWCRMDKCNLFLSTNVLTILMHGFELLFSIVSRKEKL